jgi:flagellar hook assembly protein FlgD
MKAELLSSPSCGDCSSIPDEFSVSRAYPNPFNGRVTFTIDIPAKRAVEFQIFDLRGSLVFDRLLLPGNAGSYRVNWDAKDLGGNEVSSGIYFYKFSLNNNIKSGRITYLK